jgi:hypothetical protein
MKRWSLLFRLWEKQPMRLEKVADAYFRNDASAAGFLNDVKNFHLQIIADLKFKSDEIKKELNAVFCRDGMGDGRRNRTLKRLRLCV